MADASIPSCAIFHLQTSNPRARCAARRLQVLSNMVDFGMEPQAALDAPRWRLDGVDSCIGPASVNDVT